VHLVSIISGFIIFGAALFAAFSGMWLTFEKAGRPGWSSIVPIYNIYNLTQIAGVSGWLTLLAFVPFVNVLVLGYLFHGVSKRFEKGVGFTVGLVLLGPIFFGILGWGNAECKPLQSPPPVPQNLAA